MLSHSRRGRLRILLIRRVGRLTTEASTSTSSQIASSIIIHQSQSQIQFHRRGRKSVPSARGGAVKTRTIGIFCWCRRERRWGRRGCNESCAWPGCGQEDAAEEGSTELDQLLWQTEVNVNARGASVWHLHDARGGIFQETRGAMLVRNLLFGSAFRARRARATNH